MWSFATSCSEREALVASSAASGSLINQPAMYRVYRQNSKKHPFSPFLSKKDLQPSLLSLFQSLIVTRKACRVCRVRIQKNRLFSENLSSSSLLNKLLSYLWLELQTNSTIYS
jgi:hypothetical protein